MNVKYWIYSCSDCGAEFSSKKDYFICPYCLGGKKKADLRMLPYKRSKPEIIFDLISDHLCVPVTFEERWWKRLYQLQGYLDLYRPLRNTNRSRYD